LARSELQTAWIIHRRPYREGSFLVDLLTEADGRVTAVWRKPKRGSAGEPFQQITALWTGRGEVKSLSKVENFSPPTRLAPHAMYAGFYVNELVYRLIPVGDSNRHVYSAYTYCISTLAQNTDFEPALRQFEQALMESLGVWPDLNFCVDTQDETQLDQYYRVSVLEGVRLADGLRESDTFSGMELRELQSSLYQSGCARRLFKLLVNQLLDGKPLKSRALYREFLAD